MKELKYYAHLYIGCKVVSDRVYHLVGVTKSEVEPGKWLAICDPNPEDLADSFLEFYIEEVKLILRPLDEKVMTQQEKVSWNQWKQRKGWMPGVHAEKTLWLLSNGFDVFGLYAAGLAVYE